MTELDLHSGEWSALQWEKVVGRRDSYIVTVIVPAAGYEIQDILADKGYISALWGHSIWGRGLVDWWVWELSLKREGDIKLS